MLVFHLGLVVLWILFHFFMKGRGSFPCVCYRCASSYDHLTAIGLCETLVLFPWYSDPWWVILGRDSCIPLFARRSLPSCWALAPKSLNKFVKSFKCVASLCEKSYEASRSYQQHRWSPADDTSTSWFSSLKMCRNEIAIHRNRPLSFGFCPSCGLLVHGAWQ